MRGDDPAHLVKVALGEAAAALGEESSPGPPACAIDSALPVGSGFGSSAATATGVVAGLSASSAAPGTLDPATDRAHRPGGRAAPARPPLGDRRRHRAPRRPALGAPAGGRRSGDRAGRRSARRCSPASASTTPARRPRPPAPWWPPSATAATRIPQRHERLLDRIEAATRGFRAELEREQEDPARFRELIRECEACLEELGVVPPEVRALVRRIEAAGGAAKISGAGALSGPGAGSLLVYHPDPEWISGWSFLRPFPFHPVQLGAEGLRRETDA